MVGAEIGKVTRRSRKNAAHRILDRAVMGEEVSVWRINWALRVLGDLR